MSAMRLTEVAATFGSTEELKGGGDEEEEEDSLAAAEAGRCVRNGAAKAIDPAEFATLGMDSGDSPADATRGSNPSDAAAAPGSSSASLDKFPPLWVTRWVDYTSKYGMGYVLSDGTFGVVFNDATKMTQSALDGECVGVSACHDGPPGDFLEYRERARRREGADARERRVAPAPACFAASASCPEGLEKKVKLMRHFRGYLSTDGRSAVERRVCQSSSCAALRRRRK